MKQIPLHKRKLGREAPDLIKTQKYLTSPHFLGMNLGMNYHQTHSDRDLFSLTRQAKLFRSISAVTVLLSLIKDMALIWLHRKFHELMYKSVLEKMGR